MVNLELVYPNPQLHWIIKSIWRLFCTDSFWISIYPYLIYITYFCQEIWKQKKNAPPPPPTIVNLLLNNTKISGVKKEIVIKYKNQMDPNQKRLRNFLPVG